MADRAGQQLGHYRLIRQLGRGGFADVYLGEHLFTYNSHTGLIWVIDWSRSGQQIASASQDGTVRVWQAV